MKKASPHKLILNKNNPRFIKDDKFAQLVASIKSFPEMLEKRPIVVDEDLIVLGGNMRLRACREAGLKTVPYIVADGWTDEQKAEFIIKDNVGYGNWQWDTLFNEWDTELLEDWGLELPSDVVVEPEAEQDIKDLSGDDSIDFKIEITAKDEAEQEKIYLELTKKGYSCRVLTL